LESQQQVELTIQPRQALLKVLQTLRHSVRGLVPVETLMELADLVRVGVIVRLSIIKHPPMALHVMTQVAQRLLHSIQLFATDRVLVLCRQRRRRRCLTSRGITTFMWSVFYSVVDARVIINIW
jgi:hypothetical protein